MPVPQWGKRGRFGTRLTAVLVTALTAAATAVLPAPAAPAPAAAATTTCVTRPSAEYARANPGRVGLDPAKLQAALNYAALDGSFTVKVFRHGCLAGQGARDPLFDRVPELNAGQTKTVIALVAGIVADRGWVNLDAPIGDYLPANLGDRAHRAVTMRQFMELVSGVRVNHVNGLNFFFDNSRTREYFATPLTHKPGSYYEFDEITPSVVVEALGNAIHRHQPGTDFQAFTQRNLFDPLGIPTSAYFWQRDRSGTTTGYSGLWLRPLEYGRLGQLLLDNGTFAGHRILSTGFVDSMRVGTTANCGFGLYLWLNSCKPGQSQVNTDYPSRRTYPGQAWIQSAPSDMVYSLGLGTNTFVIPSLDMVVTRSGYQELDTVPGLLNLDLHGAFPGNAGGPGDHEFFRLLMSAVTDMPPAVRATIQNPGPYNRPPDERVDLAPFVIPPTEVLGTYLGIGPEAPVGCSPLHCVDEPNDGLRWLADVPRVLPGVLGAERRPG